jgi:hypothetical protein
MFDKSDAGTVPGESPKGKSGMVTEDNQTATKENLPNNATNEDLHEVVTTGEQAPQHESRKSLLTDA